MTSPDRAHRARAAQLAELAGWKGTRPHPPDWPALEAAFGRPFPPDFKSYIEFFPPGSFGFVYVFHPFDAEFASAGYIRAYVAHLMWRTDPANDVPELPRFGNKAGELFAWGSVNGEFELCWEITADDPDTWTCVVADIPMRSVERYHGGMLDLLLDVLGGTGRVSSLEYLRQMLPLTFSG
ncbi:hypothetical protein [Catellatospora vulcania]|uniref:hypothetical protein n=1 Tax=Catellatospora vulcania TaxID=1460450 RepID=UPI0012D49589|nr:hypothetical protein [Catellatospora vulcania]